MSSHHYIPRSLDGRHHLMLTYSLRDMVPISHDVTSQLSSLCSKGIVGNPVHMCFYAPLVYPPPNVPMDPTPTLLPPITRLRAVLPSPASLLLFCPMCPPAHTPYSHLAVVFLPRCCTPLSYTCILLDDLRLGWALTLHFTLT